MSGTVEYDLTANYGLKKPWDDADDDVWGLHLNENMDLIDNLLVTRGFDASKFLPLTGGTMLGELILAADPANPLDAATKRYVDGSIGGAVGAYLPLIGGEISGDLQVDGALNVGTPGGAGFKLDVVGSLRTSGPLTVGLDTSTAAGAALFINGAAGVQRQLIFRTASLARWLIMADSAAESGANAGTNLTIGTYTDAGVYNGPVLVANRATKVVTISGSLNNTTLGQDTGVTAQFFLNAPAGLGKQLYFRSASSSRWVIQSDTSAESGSNAGSNFSIFRYDDTGVSLGNAFSITRSTGATTIAGALTLSNGGAFTGTFSGTHTYSGAVTFSGSATVAGALNATGGAVTIGTNTATQSLFVNGAAGQSRLLRFQTAGVARWQFFGNTTAEGGSNAGTDLDLLSYSDAGALLISPAMRVFRATGNFIFGGTIDAGFKLDVVGTARISGLLTLSSSLSVPGLITLGNNTAVSPTLQINGAVANQRQIQFLTAGVLRWRIAANSVAEGGANVGSDLDFTAYDDTGALLGNPMLRMSRATGLVTAYYGLSLGSTLAPGGVTDLSRGLALFSTTYGLNVTTNRLNFVSPLAIVAVVAGVDKFSVGAAGLTVIGNVGFNGTTPLAKPTVTGAKAGNTALASLCAALVSYGLIADTSTA